MLSVALAALRSKRGQAVALGLLAGLVTAGAVGTPFYVYAAEERVIARDIAAAPPGEREVAMFASVTVPDDGVAAVDFAANKLAGAFTPTDATSFNGVRAQGSLRPTGAGVRSVPVAYRDGVCERVVLQGACPSADGDVMMSSALADKLGVRLGDKLPSPLAAGAPPDLKISPVTVVGIYEARDSADPYWGNHLLTATEPVGSQDPDAIFMTRTGLLAAQPFVSVEHLAKIDPFVRDTGALSHDFSSIQVEGLRSFTVESNLAFLLDAINADINGLGITGPELAFEVVALGWFALVIVLRALAADRRSDVGLVLLRGLPGRNMWALFAQQNTIPILVAAPIGAALGYAVARLATGPIHVASRARDALILGGVALVVVLIGAVLAAAFADRRRRNTPITDLLRNVPPRRRGWRSDAVDLVVTTLAILIVVQSHIGAPAARERLTVFVPAVIGLACGLLAARLIAPIAGALVPRGLRAGRVVPVLTVTYLARRPGFDRIFALLAVATTLAGSALLNWHLAADAQDDRARVDVGADRVIQLAGASPSAVLATTRAIDPDGRYLMAAVDYTNNLTGDVVSVDSPRLARVMDLGSDPGGRSPADIAALLRPAAPRSVAVANGTLRLVARTQTVPDLPIFAVISLVNSGGERREVPFGPLRPDTATYTAPVTGCDPACRFVGVSISPALAAVAADATQANVLQGEVRLGGAARGASVVFAGLDDPGTGAKVPVDFTDRNIWRTTLNSGQVGPTLAAGPDGLTLSLSNDEQLSRTTGFDEHVFLVDSPLPVPLIAAGPPELTSAGGAAGIQPFGNGPVPVSVVAAQPVLPVLGTFGSMMDLEYALHAAGTTVALGTPEVWLRADTPAAMVDRLRSIGVTVSDDQTRQSAVSRYRDQVPETVRWLALALAAIAVALALIALLLAAVVERGARSTELAALRTQGVDRTAVSRTAAAGYFAICGGAVLVGLIGTLVAVIFRTGDLQVFSDGWDVLPPPDLYQPGGWLLTVVLCAIPFLAGAAVVTRQLVHAVTAK
jgi:putative ABC transport system permease protein